MRELTADPRSQARLRQQAQDKLVAGVAPLTRGWGISVETLALLHRLAGTPANAADALKLLHELQVHQVELDLQQAQLEASEKELTDELAHYRALYQHAAVAQFVLDARDRIEECNRAGAELLGSPGGGVEGRRFDEFLSFDSRLPLAALLRDARRGAAATMRTLRPVPDQHAVPSWQIAASALPERDAILLAVTARAESPAG